MSLPFKPAAYVTIGGKVWHPRCWNAAHKNGPRNTGVGTAMSVWPVPKRCEWCKGGPFGPETSKKKK
jgi:hypothetical protein